MAVLIKYGRRSYRSAVTRANIQGQLITVCAGQAALYMGITEAGWPGMRLPTRSTAAARSDQRDRARPLDEAVGQSEPESGQFDQCVFGASAGWYRSGSSDSSTAAMSW